MRVWVQCAVLWITLISLTGCGTAATSMPPETDSARAEGHHSQAAHEASGHEPGEQNYDGDGEHTHAVLGPNSDNPFDARFIDTLIEHHLGAVRMAEAAREKAEHPEIVDLAEEIIVRQPKEIDKINQWRTKWYPNLPATEGMNMGMGAMSVASDPNTPFDERFLTAMISHHEAAAHMAREAEKLAEHAELKEMAKQLLNQQVDEIEQMKQWKQQWFGE